MNVWQKIAEYWLTFVLAGIGGLITTAITITWKKHKTKMEKLKAFEAEAQKKSQREYYQQLTDGIRKENRELVDSLVVKYADLNAEVSKQYEDTIQKMTDALTLERKQSLSGDEKLQTQINEISIQMESVKAGLLSMQGKEFKDACRRLLKENHTISLDEWEDIVADHEAYNGLNGNHKGDELFRLVEQKVKNNLTANH